MKKSRYIAPLIMLIAGTVISIYNIVNQSSLTYFLVSLLVVLVVFYWIGLIVRYLLHRIANMEVKFISRENSDDGSFVDLTVGNNENKKRQEEDDRNLYEEDS